MVENRTPGREVGGSKPNSAVLCLEQNTLLPESTDNTQKPLATSRHDFFKLIEGKNENIKIALAGFEPSPVGFCQNQAVPTLIPSAKIHVHTVHLKALGI